jgi:cytochrome c-type biogenesis protein CcmH/NrfG
MTTTTVPKRPDNMNPVGKRIRRPLRRISVRWLVISIVACVCLTLAVYYGHKYQSPRLAEQLLNIAQSREGAEKWQSAASYLSRYLRLNPDDAAQRVRLARLYTKYARSVTGPRENVERKRAIGYGR